MRLTLTNINISPYLSDDWRLKAKGNVSGEVTVHTPIFQAHGGQKIWPVRSTSPKGN